LRAAPATRGRRVVEHAAAAQRLPCRLVAQDHAVAAQRERGRIEHQLHESCGAWGKGVAFKHGDPAGDAGRAEVRVHRRPMLQRAPGMPPNAQLYVEPVGGRVQLRCHQPVAAIDEFLVELGTGEVQRAALARRAALRGRVLRVDAAHAHFEAAR
jgi:hypothetical protein